MKKALLVLSVLLIILSTATAGTVSGNTFRIKSHVGRITIEQANEEAKLFTIKVSTGDTESTSDDTNYYLSGFDIAEEDVVVVLEITQNATTRTDETITLTADVSPFSMSDDTGSYASEEILIDNVKGNPDNNGLTVESEVDNFKKSLSMVLTYDGASTEVEAGSKIATFRIVWTKNPELAAHPGIYTADITLTYDIN
ncbi:MAG: hypothetical protein ILP16_10995 [Spirochaetales bacterium]|nr:hypothetical protein [Spirochaetales bacterium]